MCAFVLCRYVDGLPMMHNTGGNGGDGGDGGNGMPIIYVCLLF